MAAQRHDAELARIRAEVAAATDAERRRIERDLHDDVQQRLVALTMNLGIARELGSPAAAQAALDRSRDEALDIVAQVCALARGVYPPLLVDRGLDAALSGLTAAMPLPVRARVRLARRCPPGAEAVVDPPGGGTGLAGLAERVGALGGR